MDTRIVRCEIVPATYDASKFEVKVYHVDGTWMYFSRGFATRKEAEQTVARLMPQGKRTNPFLGGSR